MYVLERLNDVFGVGSWRAIPKIVEVTTTDVVVEILFQIPEYGIELIAYGGNNNADRGDAYKGAMTDAFTKVCSWLEIGIDVFKGKHGDKTGQSKPVPQPPVSRPTEPAKEPQSKPKWLNKTDPRWEDIVTFTKNTGDIEQVVATLESRNYKISKPMRATLETIIAG
jgi:hypothetical protein